MEGHGYLNGGLAVFKVQMGDFEGSLSDLVEPVEKQEIDL